MMWQMYNCRRLSGGGGGGGKQANIMERRWIFYCDDQKHDDKYLQLTNEEHKKKCVEFPRRNIKNHLAFLQLSLLNCSLDLFNMSGAKIC